ncbi:MAG: hypothetical protein FJY77_03705 [Candidatus Altiarchaeales archaeon]|nr:hypothetical protein [Candidatus Altiarchaeales archaeon]
MNFNVSLSGGDLALQDHVAYSYVYGMVCGMQSRFLGKKDFETFSSAHNLNELTALLAKTDYSTEVEKLSAEPSDLEIETSVGGHFLRVYEEVASSVPAEDREVLDDLILGETDLRNVKAVVRGIHHSLRPGEIRLMVLPGRKSADVVEKMVSSKTVEEAISYLGDEVEMGLEGALGDYKKSGSILPIEMALDRLLVERWLSNTSLLEYAKLKIDLLNILNVFRCRMAEIPFRRYMMPNGLNLDDRYLTAFEGMPPEEISSALAATPYSELSRKFPHSRVDLLKLEASMEKLLQNEVDIKSTVNPLSIWSVAGFLSLKQREVNKVRLLMLLKKHNFPAEKMKSVLT